MKGDFKIYMWYDKIDQCHPNDGIMISDSERSVCRGYIKQFEADRKMNPAEFELHCIADIDLVSGVITPYAEPKVIDPRQVYSQSPEEDYKVLSPAKKN